MSNLKLKTDKEIAESQGMSVEEWRLKQRRLNKVATNLIFEGWKTYN